MLLTLAHPLLAVGIAVAVDERTTHGLRDLIRGDAKLFQLLDIVRSKNLNLTSGVGIEELANLSC